MDSPDLPMSKFRLRRQCVLQLESQKSLSDRHTRMGARQGEKWDIADAVSFTWLDLLHPFSNLTERSEG
jgi:hypothetical protein